MRIQDYESICNVANPADIAAALNSRYGASRNAFWLSHGDKEHPTFSVLVNGELAYLLYFPKEGHPQGNRVKESCGDEAGEELVVPRGDFALEAEAVLTGSSADQIGGIRDLHRSAR